MNKIAVILALCLGVSQLASAEVGTFRIQCERPKTDFREAIAIAFEYAPIRFPGKFFFGEGDASKRIEDMDLYDLQSVSIGKGSFELDVTYTTHPSTLEKNKLFQGDVILGVQLNRLLYGTDNNIRTESVWLNEKRTKIVGGGLAYYGVNASRIDTYKNCISIGIW